MVLLMSVPQEALLYKLFTSSVDIDHMQEGVATLIQAVWRSVTCNLWSSKVQADSRRINFKARDSPEFGALSPFELTNRPLVSTCDPGTSSVADCESVFMLLLCYVVQQLIPGSQSCFMSQLISPSKRKCI